MGISTTFNFGLVHEPASFNYEVDWDALGDQISDETLDVLGSFTEEELLFLRWRMCWKALARSKQLPPEEFENLTKTTWGIRSGRGFGKTLCAGNWLGIEAAAFPGRYAVVAPTHDDVRYTCFEGPTGLYSVIPPKLIAETNSSLPAVELWNGSIIRGFAGDTPERLRGPQHHAAWCDEIASWKYPEKAWDNLMFGLRLGPHPRVCWTSTPKPTPFVKDRVDDPRAVVVVGSTYENRENLTDLFFDNVAKYEGTKVGRQELYGELLDPEEEGFVKRSQWRMWPHDKPLPKFEFIILSLDTAFTEKTHDKKEQTNDPTACSVWGMFNVLPAKHDDDRIKALPEKHVMLLDCWEDYLGLPELIRRVKKERKLTYGDADEPLLRPRVRRKAQRVRHQGRKVDLILIEDKGSGISLRQSLATENILSYPYNPGKQDKLTRLHLVSPLYAHGRVWAVESEVNRGQFKGWADPLITQVCSYVGEGSIRFDDLMDTATQALRYFYDKFFDALTVRRNPEDVKRRKIIAEQQRRKRKTNPYS